MVLLASDPLQSSSSCAAGYTVPAKKKSGPVSTSPSPSSLVVLPVAWQWMHAAPGFMSELP